MHSLAFASNCILRITSKELVNAVRGEGTGRKPEQETKGVAEESTETQRFSHLFIGKTIFKCNFETLDESRHSIQCSNGKLGTEESTEEGRGRGCAGLCVWNKF